MVEKKRGILCGQANFKLCSLNGEIVFFYAISANLSCLQYCLTRSERYRHSVWCRQFCYMVCNWVFFHLILFEMFRFFSAARDKMFLYRMGVRAKWN